MTVQLLILISVIQVWGLIHVLGCEVRMIFLWFGVRFLGVVVLIFSWFFFFFFLTMIQQFLHIQRESADFNKTL